MKRVRRQALVKTKGSDGGPDSVTPLPARSSSSLASMIRNILSSVALNTRHLQYYSGDIPGAGHQSTSKVVP